MTNKTTRIILMTIAMIGCGGDGSDGKNTAELVTERCDADRVLLPDGHLANQCMEMRVPASDKSFAQGCAPPFNFSYQACRRDGSLGRCDDVSVDGHKFTMYLFDDGVAVDATGAKVECENLGGKLVLPADYDANGGNLDMSSRTIGGNSTTSDSNDWSCRARFDTLDCIEWPNVVPGARAAAIAQFCSFTDRPTPTVTPCSHNGAIGYCEEEAGGVGVQRDYSYNPGQQDYYSNDCAQRSGTWYTL